MQVLSCLCPLHFNTIDQNIWSEKIRFILYRDTHIFHERVNARN